MSTRRALRASISLRCAIPILILAAASGCIRGQRIPDGMAHRRRVDDATGWEVHELRAGDVSIQVVPAAGANVFSYRIGGTELLRQAPSLDRVEGVSFGMPLLYPTPNRVRGGSFTFEGNTYEFPKNSRGNHIHGFVHSLPWTYEGVEIAGDALRLELSLSIDAKHPAWGIFPFEHRLSVAYAVRPTGLTVEFEVKNLGTRRVPFGLGIHPYFAIHGDRGDTFLTVPARHYMVRGRFSMLPSGDLGELQGSPLDLREPTSIAALDLDDVYIGMVPERPAVYENRAAGIRVEIIASDIFTHAVVYTPGGQEFFCLENQTCSTDAHNLYREGKTDAAHLLILEPAGGPGSVVEGSIEYRLAPLSSGI